MKEKKIIQFGNKKDEAYSDGDFTAIQIGLKDEEEFGEYLKADDGQIYMEFKSINHNDKNKRLLVETSESLRYGDEYTPCGINTSKSKLWIWSFLNYRGERKILPVFTDWMWGTLQFGAKGKDEWTTRAGQAKTGIHIPFIVLIRYILVIVFGLTEGKHFTLNDDLLSDDYGKK